MRNYAQPKFLYEIIKKRGLTSNLNLVLDAGDPRSYDGSSQTWTDATGNGNNFYRGTTSGSDSTDPTFNGTAYDWRATTYFSFDGGDFFKETAAHTFADNWHKNNGALTLIAIMYVTNAGATRAIFNTDDSATLGVGMGLSSAEKLVFEHGTDNTSGQQLQTSTAAATVDSWNFLAASMDEATTAGSLHINSTVETYTATASTATNAKATNIRIGALSDAAGSPLASGDRLACLAAWSTKISDTNIQAIYSALKSRRFTTLP